MMKTVVSSVVACTIAALATPTVVGAADLAVGDAAPALELEASDGRVRSLEGEDSPKVLIFYRGLW